MILAIKYFRKTPHRRFFEGFWIYQGFEYSPDSEHARAIPGF